MANEINSASITEAVKKSVLDELQLKSLQESVDALKKERDDWKKMALSKAPSGKKLLHESAEDLENAETIADQVEDYANPDTDLGAVLEKVAGLEQGQAELTESVKKISSLLESFQNGVSDKLHVVTAPTAAAAHITESEEDGEEAPAKEAPAEGEPEPAPAEEAPATDADELKAYRELGTPEEVAIAVDALQHYVDTVGDVETAAELVDTVQAISEIAEDVDELKAMADGIKAYEEEVGSIEDAKALVDAVEQYRDAVGTIEDAQEIAESKKKASLIQESRTIAKEYNIEPEQAKMLLESVGNKASVETVLKSGVSLNPLHESRKSVFDRINALHESRQSAPKTPEVTGRVARLFNR